MVPCVNAMKVWLNHKISVILVISVQTCNIGTLAIAAFVEFHIKRSDDACSSPTFSLRCRMISQVGKIMPSRPLTTTMSTVGASFDSEM